MHRKTSLICVFTFVLALFGSLTAQEQGHWSTIPDKGSSPEAWRQWHRQQFRLAKKLGLEDEKQGIHNGNRIETIFYNYGTIAAPGTALDIVWPKGSGQGYGFEFGIIGGAEVVDINGAQRHILSEHLADGGDQSPGGSPWGWEPLPGYANPNQDNLAMSDCQDNDGPDGVPNSGDDDGKPDCWPTYQNYVELGLDPLTNPFYDADNDRLIWPGEYGFDVTTADQESFYIMDDQSNAEFRYFPYIKEGFERQTADVASGTPGDSLLTLTDANADFQGADLVTGESNLTDRVEIIDPTSNQSRYYFINQVVNGTTLELKTISASPRSIESDWSGVTYSIRNGQKRGLGLKVEARGYQWAHTLAQDCIFFIYDFRNVASDTLNKVYFAMYGDPHIGGRNDYGDDDSGYDTKIDMVYSWDHDFTGDGGFRPGYLGYSFLESPGDPDNGIDDDQDGMVDESMQDNIDNDNDWDAFTDYNNNGQWDDGEPLNDDVGADGIGPEHPSYLGPDAGEGDGVPTHGEPDFDETDLDEADQIGLTSFAAMIYGSRIMPGQDEPFWDRITSGIIESEINQTTDNIFIYSSGPITMAPDQSRRFSISLLLGHDETDLFRSANTVQDIYNAGYQFVKAPYKPQMTAVPGDGRVTLYWDTRSERSYDPLYGNDFEGYAIYRATDIGFNDVFNITDAQGNPKLWEPMARFDKVDGFVGPHPVEQVNGIHYYMGDNTGLSHTFVDTTVTNGQQYYYAVVAYDTGSVKDGISPTETTKTIKIGLDGVIQTDDNTIVITPHAVSAGYEEPEINEAPDDRYAGPGTGEIQTSIMNPSEVKSDGEYIIHFLDTATDGVDNDGDWSAFSDDNSNGVWDVGEPLNDDVGSDGLAPGDANYSGPDADGTQGNGKPDLGEPNFENHDFQEMIRNTTSYSLTDISNPDQPQTLINKSRYLNGEDANPVLDGLLIKVINDSLQIDDERTSWDEGDANLTTSSRVFPNNGLAFPADYQVIIDNDTANVDFFGHASNFKVWNKTDDDLNGNGQYDSGEPLTNYIFQEPQNSPEKEQKLSTNDKIILLAFEQEDTQPRGTWEITYNSPAKVAVDAAIDGNGRIWFATGTGLTEYFENQWTQVRPNNVIRTVYADDQSYKWLGSDNGVQKYRFGEVSTVSRFDGIRVNDIGRDAIGKYWFATDSSVFSFDGAVYNNYKPGNNGPLGNAINALDFDSDNNLWFGTDYGVSYFDGSTWENNTVNRTALPDTAVMSLYVDNSDNVWIGTAKGLAEYNGNSTSAVSAVSNVQVRDISTGPNDEIWCATNNGVYRFTGSGWQHDTLNVSSSNQVGPTSNDIRSVNYIGGTMYVGTNDGVDYFTDGEWGTFNPQLGDKFLFATRKQFSHYDSYTFTTTAQMIDEQVAKEDLKKVAVVPNPYVAAATWEPKPNLLAGRGERRIWFIHLPQEGTIRIFTITGELVKTINFSNNERDGSVSWDLLNDDQLEIAYGVYLFQVDSPVGTVNGKFAIVK